MVKKSSKKAKATLMALARVRRPSKKKPKVPRRLKLLSQPPKLRLSDCAAKFALALAYPFNPLCFGVCFPGAQAEETMRCHATVAGTLPVTVLTGSTTTFLAKIGMIPSLSNDGPCAYISNTASAGIVSQFPTDLSVKTDAVNYDHIQVYHNGPFNYTSISSANPSQLAGRVVAAGLRIRFDGADLYNSGVQHYAANNGTMEMENIDILGNNATYMTSLPTYYNCNNKSGGWHYIVSYPKTPAQQAISGYRAGHGTDIGNSNHPLNIDPGYAGSLHTISHGGYSSAWANICSGFVAVTTNQYGLFSYEIINHLEYSGILAGPMSRPNEVDKAGYDVVDNASAIVETERRAHPNADPYGLYQKAIAAAGYLLPALSGMAFTHGIRRVPQRGELPIWRDEF